MAEHSAAVTRAATWLGIASDDAVKMGQLDALGEQALDFIVGVCNNEFLDAAGALALPRGVVAVQFDMIVWGWNRRGSEGLNSEGLGGNSISFAPIAGEMLPRLYPYRQMRVW